MSTHIGEFVFASAGRDAGKCFIAVSCEGDYLYLCDGKGRKVQCPKKKKKKHVAFSGCVSEEIQLLLTEHGEVTNKMVRSAIRGYKRQRTEI